MPEFRYTAISAGGELQTGVMSAATEADAIARLQRLGNLPVSAEPAEPRGVVAELLRANFVARRGLRAQEVADLTRELAIMLAAGQDLDRALRYAQTNARGARLRRVVTELRDAVRDGSPLHAALARQPGSFSRLYVGMVQAGEAGAVLAATLARLGDLLDRQRNLAAAVTSAMIYPCVLLGVACFAVTFLLSEVVPEFVPLFADSGASLPASTQALIAAGDFISHDGPFVLGALAALFLLARMVLRRSAPRLVADRLKLSVPFLGGFLKEVLAARFTRTLGTLLTSGLPLITALGIVRDALGNAAAVAAVDLASVSVRGGAGLSQPLADAQIFPARTIDLLRLGEENAQLGPTALRAAEIHEERSRAATQRMLALLVPAITILMGSAVAGIITSLLTAMLRLNDLAAG